MARLVAALMVVMFAGQVRAEKQPADTLDGPPHVTARAWVIAEGKTGKVLWGHNDSAPAKAASTAKMMNLWVVVQLAKADPKVLDEIVTISKYADGIGGSTGDVKEGEKIAVRDLLMAVMLPSGNDAATAIAEHFNARLAPPSEKPALVTPRTNFLAEMNRQAAKLGMSDTVYRSVFGDGVGAQEMTASPRDLVKLAVAGLRDPLFSRIVATEKHEADVVKPDGSTRRATWINSNELLKIEGYDGVKTGTTTSAGACLVSSGRRGEDHLIVVVLGSAPNPARFVDSRNLYRWAWQQR